MGEAVNLHDFPANFFLFSGKRSGEGMPLIFIYYVTLDVV